jgi:hypothetical protein
MERDKRIIPPVVLDEESSLGSATLATASVPYKLTYLLYVK